MTSGKQAITTARAPKPAGGYSPAVAIGHPTNRAGTTSMTYRRRVVLGQAGFARMQTIAAAPESLRTRGVLPMRPILSRVQDGNHPSGPRAIAHTIGDSPP